MRKLTFGLIVLIPILTLLGAVWWVRANEAWHDETLAAAAELYEKGDFDAAQPLLARLARRFPNETQTQYMLGEASFALGDRVMALTAFDNVLHGEQNARWIPAICRLIHAGVEAKVAGPTSLKRLPILSPGGEFVVLDPRHGASGRILTTATAPDSGQESPPADEAGRTYPGSNELLFAQDDTVVFSGTKGAGSVVKEVGDEREVLRVSGQALSGLPSDDGSRIVYVQPPASDDTNGAYRLAVFDTGQAARRYVYSSRSPIDLLWVSNDAGRAVVLTKPPLAYALDQDHRSLSKPRFVLIDLAGVKAAAAVAFDQALMAESVIAATDGNLAAAVASVGDKHPLFVGRFESELKMRSIADLGGPPVEIAVSEGRVIAAAKLEKTLEISSCDPATGKKKRLAKMDTPRFGGVAFSKDGTICVYAAMSKGEAGSDAPRQVICLLETDTGRNFLLLAPKLGVYDDVCKLDISDDGKVVMYCVGRGRIVLQQMWPTHREYEMYTFDMTRIPPRGDISRQLYERLSRMIYSS